MPNLVASYFLVSPIAGDSSTLVTTSFTPTNGEVIVVKAATWDTGTPSGTPSGGGLTYTQRAIGQPGGFNCYSTIFTAVVSGSPGSMAVTLSAPATSSYHSMTVERWSNAQLAATPATNSVITGNGTTPSDTVITTAANSVVTWVNADDSSQGGTHTYLSGAVEDGLADGSSFSNSVHYYAYQTAAAAGSQTFGMSLPTAQKWTMVGIEVQDNPAAPPTAVTWLFTA
ncbi:MAG TPA: hypothetical protein VLF60_05345 [Candidatus Saccharimonadales bacterium]|nr:hypothetical protein [Candidatus Saccharimonadales bacterium]